MSDINNQAVLAQRWNPRGFPFSWEDSHFPAKQLQQVTTQACQEPILHSWFDRFAELISQAEGIPSIDSTWPMLESLEDMGTIVCKDSFLREVFAERYVSLCHISKPVTKQQLIVGLSELRTRGTASLKLSEQIVARLQNLKGVDAETNKGLILLKELVDGTSKERVRLITDPLFSRTDLEIYDETKEAIDKLNRDKACLDSKPFLDSLSIVMSYWGNQNSPECITALVAARQLVSQPVESISDERRASEIARELYRYIFNESEGHLSWAGFCFAETQEKLLNKSSEAVFSETSDFVKKLNASNRSNNSRIKDILICLPELIDSESEKNKKRLQAFDQLCEDIICAEEKYSLGLRTHLYLMLSRLSLNPLYKGVTIKRLQKVFNVQAEVVVKKHQDKEEKVILKQAASLIDQSIGRPELLRKLAQLFDNAREEKEIKRITLIAKEVRPNDWYFYEAWTENGKTKTHCIGETLPKEYDLSSVKIAKSAKKQLGLS